MKIDIKTVVLSVRDLPPSRMADAYRNNPCLENMDQPVKMEGRVGGKLIGKVWSLPMPLWADGREYITSANPDIDVLPEYRKTGYALDLLEFGTTASRDKIKVDFYVSKSARKVARLCGGCVFDISQFAVVRDSSLFLEKRLSGWVALVVCGALNFVFGVHRIVLGALVALKTRHWTFQCADNGRAIEEFTNLIKQDEHRFKPNATDKFYAWILKNDFGDIDESDKHLWRVAANGELLGFVIARRNGARGRVIDWQVAQGHETDIPWLLLATARRCLPRCKAVVFSISSIERNLIQVLRRLLPRLPTQAATVSVGDGSPLLGHDGWREQANWRIRPTMGDSCLY